MVCTGERGLNIQHGTFNFQVKRMFFEQKAVHPSKPEWRSWAEVAEGEILKF